MYYVYLLRSIPNPDQTYIGFTEDLKTRLTTHNHGQSPHTAKFKPWDLITYLAFKDRTKALSFEKFQMSIFHGRPSFTYFRNLLNRLPCLRHDLPAAATCPGEVLTKTETRQSEDWSFSGLNRRWEHLNCRFPA